MLLRLPAGTAAATAAAAEVVQHNMPCTLLHAPEHTCVSNLQDKMAYIAIIPEFRVKKGRSEGTWACSS